MHPAVLGVGGFRGRKFSFFKFNPKNVPNLEEEGGVREGHSYRFNDGEKLLRFFFNKCPKPRGKGCVRRFLKLHKCPKPRIKGARSRNLSGVLSFNLSFSLSFNLSIFHSFNLYTRRVLLFEYRKKLTVFIFVVGGRGMYARDF